MNYKNIRDGAKFNHLLDSFFYAHSFMSHYPNVPFNTDMVHDMGKNIRCFDSNVKNYLGEISSKEYKSSMGDLIEYVYVIDLKFSNTSLLVYLSENMEFDKETNTYEYVVYNIQLAYHELTEQVSNIYDSLLSYKIDTPHNKQAVNFSLISHGMDGYELLTSEVDMMNVPIGIHYGENSVDEYNDLVSRLRTNESGLCLFHGNPGTGKTHYLYKLAYDIQYKDVDEGVKPTKIIFVPSMLAGELDAPGFISFLMKQTNSILIIEDAEVAIQKRTGNSFSGTSTILNITDGILGKMLNMKIICTFNTSISNIDDALLRAGRCIIKKEFCELGKEDANKVCDYHDVPHIDKDATLGEIFNQQNIKHEASTFRPIGFSRPNNRLNDIIDKLDY